jgi:multiple sugar transport system permease protein
MSTKSREVKAGVRGQGSGVGSGVPAGPSDRPAARPALTPDPWPLTPGAKRPRGLSKRDRQHLLNGLLFCSPWLIGFSVFLLYPIMASFYYSLTEFSVLQPPAYIGLTNYRELMADGVFWKGMGNTFYYAALALPLGMMVAIAIAMLLNTDVKGMTIYRTIYFLPSLVPAVATAILWLWIFNGQYGVLNYGLTRLHLHGPDWLSNPAWVKPALILLSVWGVGNSVVIYLAGLQDVPEHLYEAADLDGAHWLQKIRHVTLPMLSPVILFNLIIGIIGTFQYFAIPFVMAPAGTPARSAYFIAVDLYDNAFSYLQMGYASAVAWILFLMIAALTALAFWASKGRVHYGGGS